MWYRKCVGCLYVHDTYNVLPDTRSGGEEEDLCVSRCQVLPRLGDVAYSGVADRVSHPYHGVWGMVLGEVPFCKVFCGHYPSLLCPLEFSKQWSSSGRLTVKATRYRWRS